MQSLSLLPWNWLSDDNSSRETLSTTPARALSEVNRNVEQMTDSFWRNAPLPGMQLMKEFIPEIHIEESDKEYSLTFSIPTLKEEDLEVHVKNGRLHISGSQQTDTSEKDEKGKVTQLFQSASSFSQSLNLPINSDEKNIEAQFEDGTLTITVPKLESERDDPSRIAINGKKKTSEKKRAS